MKTVTMRLTELNALIDKADRALDGDSNDAEHDALYDLRETLAEMSTDPNRRDPWCWQSGDEPPADHSGGRSPYEAKVYEEEE